jgi:hypothetical protein
MAHTAPMQFVSAAVWTFSCVSGHRGDQHSQA